MRRLLAAATIAGALVTPVTIVEAQAAPHCRPGEAPRFVSGFARLKSIIGPIMGEPVECAHPNLDNGDVVQGTTTGVAYRPWYANDTYADLTTFSDSWRHWQYTPDGVIYWEGPSDVAPDIACAWLPEIGPYVSDQPRGDGFWTVIVGSFPTRPEAEATAVRLCASGEQAGILFSSQFASLRPSYWIAYAGTVPDSDAAAREAERLRAGVPRGVPAVHQALSGPHPVKAGTGGPGSTGVNHSSEASRGSH